MLILSRKLGEQIVIGPEGPDQVVVTLIRNSGGRVALGLDAGRHVPIRRAELVELPIVAGDSKLAE